MSRPTAAAAGDDAEPSAAPDPAPDARLVAIAAHIRNGLSNGPIAQSHAAWDHLQTRLGEIARAILQEL